MLDEKDLAILGILKKDSRRSTKAIATELEMPRATVHERIKRMVEKGIIKGFTVKIDHAKMGRPITAFILISFLPEPTISQRNLAQDIAMMDGVQEVHLISGEYDILVKVRGASMESIGSLVIDRIRMLRGVGRTLTCSSFAAVKDEM
ncbi:MAG: Lrp/AsnC family transcriptional regulator [Methanomassiliicoccales archaeon]|nr:Lrp/AsnC family transcriptional regulator [Methanomassiliicoccales archaeon]